MTEENLTTSTLTVGNKALELLDFSFFLFLCFFPTVSVEVARFSSVPSFLPSVLLLPAFLLSSAPSPRLSTNAVQLTVPIGDDGQLTEEEGGKEKEKEEKEAGQRKILQPPH